MSFTLAMKAVLTPERSTEEMGVKTRCLVVTRIESATNLLTMVDLGPFQLPVPFPPDFNGIMLGEFTSTDSAGNQIFALKKAPPAGLHLSTFFIPTTGEVVLGKRRKLPMLWGKVEGCASGERQPATAFAGKWTIRASYVQWDGELHSYGCGGA